MLKLFFCDLFSVLTTVFILGMVVFIALASMQRNKIKKWGRLILIFIHVGTAISGLSAMRDAYMTEDALFSVNSMQSTVCSIIGGLIFLTGFLSIFIRNQKYKKAGFHLVSILFIIQVITIEATRVVFSIGGMI
ncbi:MAG: hypothetical protein AB9835_13645 [Eubacteriales bacterium]